MLEHCGYPIRPIASRLLCSGRCLGDRSARSYCGGSFHKAETHRKLIGI
ncbi:MAG: hypothetical protein V7L23_31030 [Nostoc sp.]